MRWSSSVARALGLAAACAAAGCTAIDNFGKFTFDGGTASGCSGGCSCVPANSAMNVPEHCYIPPVNGAMCPVEANQPPMMLSGGYIIDTGANPPMLTGPGLQGGFAGMSQGPSAVFCLSSLIADGTTTIQVRGSRPLVLVATSVIQFAGVIHASGAYASDDTGALGNGGGAPGGGSGMGGMGMGAGRMGLMGAGGSGGANAIGGFAGGGTMNASNTSPPSALMMPGTGSGGGGGGAGNSKGGGGGGGGGYVQLSASWSITLDNAGIDATGGGGAGGLASIGTAAPGTGGGGGGGGSGGLIILDAPTVNVMSGCLSVLGGPGGEGGGATRAGRGTVQRTDCPFSGGPSGAPMLGAGGIGGFPSPNGVDAAGQSGVAMGGGGGGTGGGGRVIVRAHVQPANLPGTVVSPQASPAFQFIPLTP